jgi:phosphoribosylformylglycinamidine synthase subunit PurQ / glutaminase
MKAAIVVFPGSNRERDAEAALTQAMGRKPTMVWHRDTELPDVDLVLVPGGFSYGDYLRCGAIAAHSPILREVKARADKGMAVIGVCNGFQIITEAGLLPGILLRNASLKFVCRNIRLKVETSQSLFTSQYEQGQVLSIPVAHHDGNYFADDRTLDELESNGQVAFRYCSPGGEFGDEHNPNGSARNIAGIFNRTKNVLGLMPHP